MNADLIAHLTEERNRWQARAFDLGNGMMEAMAERDEARRTVIDDRHEHMVFNTLARDLWADLIATRTRLKELDRAAEMLWVTVANASGSDWSQQSEEWQAAAAQWRDAYFAVHVACRESK